MWFQLNDTVRNRTIGDGQDQSSRLNSIRWIVEFDYSTENRFVRVTLSNRQIPDEPWSTFLRKRTLLLKDNDVISALKQEITFHGKSMLCYPLHS